MNSQLRQPGGPDTIGTYAGTNTGVITGVLIRLQGY